MAHIAYLKQRLAQWEAGEDMDALLRAADHIDLLSPDERKAWEVDDDRADELAEAVQEAIDFIQDGLDECWAVASSPEPVYLSDGSRWE